MGEIQICCMHVDLYERSVDRRTNTRQGTGQILDRLEEEYLRKRMMSIMLCTNWVCAGTFVHHEWVSSRTIIQREEDHFKHDVGFQNRCSVRGPKEPLVVFCTYEFESDHGQ